MALQTITWKFPSIITLEEVADYAKKFDRMPHFRFYTFDLSHTNQVHSSYIGFLIDVKQKLDRVNGRLSIETSSSLEKIFEVLEVGKFFI